jgi:hypothetical protein
MQNWANDPKLVSYPQILAEGAIIGSLPAAIHGSVGSQYPGCTTTSAPISTPSTPSPTA